MVESALAVSTGLWESQIGMTQETVVNRYASRISLATFLPLSLTSSMLVLFVFPVSSTCEDCIERLA